MGCSTCKSECGREDGCGSRKAEQKDLLDGLIARLYPSRTWGQPDDEASFRGGFTAKVASPRRPVPFYFIQGHWSTFRPTVRTLTMSLVTRLAKG